VSICALALKYNVNQDTLRAHLNLNHISIDVFNATKQALIPTQEDILIQWVIEMANQNLSLQPCVIWEKAGSRGCPSKEPWAATCSSLLHMFPWMEQILAQLSCNRLIATKYRPNSTPRRMLVNRTMRRRFLGSEVQLFGQTLKLLKVCIPIILSRMGRRLLGIGAR
jgi:hypothetical protein